jgi:hypothetical protein
VNLVLTVLPDDGGLRYAGVPLHPDQQTSTRRGRAWPIPCCTVWRVAQTRAIQGGPVFGSRALRHPSD